MLSDVRSKISDLFKELSDRVTESPSNSQPPDVEAGVASVAAPAAEAPTVAATPSAQPEAVSVVVESPPKIPAATAGTSTRRCEDILTSTGRGTVLTCAANRAGRLNSSAALAALATLAACTGGGVGRQPAQASAPTVATKKKRASSVDA